MVQSMTSSLTGLILEASFILLASFKEIDFNFGSDFQPYSWSLRDLQMHSMVISNRPYRQPVAAAQ